VVIGYRLEFICTAIVPSMHAGFHMPCVYYFILPRCIFQTKEVNTVKQYKDPIASPSILFIYLFCEEIFIL
jgi:hypothetical protein